MLFLISYVPIILLFDCIPLYPKGILPPSMLSLHDWYKHSFNDQLVITQPPWFRFFNLTEPFYQLPVATWAIWALKSKSYKAPLHLVVWAVVCCGTTLTCMVDFWYNELLSQQELSVLLAMYGSYGVIFAVIGLDMFCRIQKSLGAAAANAKVQKVQ